MAKTSFSFCPLLLCSSSPRDKISVRRKKEFLYIWSCKFLSAVSYFQGINSIVGSSHSSPSVLHPSPAHSRRTQHCKPPATPTLHYTQHYTLHYTQHCRNAARGSIGAAFRVRTEKSSCIFISFLKSIKAPNCCPCQQFGSVACSVACSVAWGCHATLVTFMSFFEKDSASSLLLVRQPFSGMPALLCPACVAI